MRDAREPLSEVDLVGEEAAYLSAVEVGLGSLLHGLAIPMAGYFLSLNQVFFLSRAVGRGRRIEGARTLPLSISMIASLLKSLSPAGKKLTPMMAISMQGLLFALGTIGLGPNLAGAVVGAAISSVWAFVQMILVIPLLYGHAALEVARFYDGHYSLYRLIAALILLKMILSMAVAIAGYRMPERLFARYRARLASAAPGVAAAQPLTPGVQRPEPWLRSARGALRDLLSPLFLLSLAMTGAYLAVSEASYAGLLWRLMRPIAVAFALFFVLRRIPLGWLLERLARSRFHRWGKSLETALRMLRSSK